MTLYFDSELANYKIVSGAHPTIERFLSDTMNNGAMNRVYPGITRLRYIGIIFDNLSSLIKNDENTTDTTGGLQNNTTDDFLDNMTDPTAAGLLLDNSTNTTNGLLFDNDQINATDGLLDTNSTIEIQNTGTDNTEGSDALQDFSEDPLIDNDPNDNIQSANLESKEDMQTPVDITSDPATKSNSLGHAYKMWVPILVVVVCVLIAGVAVALLFVKIRERRRGQQQMSKQRNHPLAEQNNVADDLEIGKDNDNDKIEHAQIVSPKPTSRRRISNNLDTQDMPAYEKQISLEDSSKFNINGSLEDENEAGQEEDFDQAYQPAQLMVDRLPDYDMEVAKSFDTTDSPVRRGMVLARSDEEWGADAELTSLGDEEALQAIGIHSSIEEKEPFVDLMVSPLMIHASSRPGSSTNNSKSSSSSPPTSFDPTIEAALMKSEDVNAALPSSARSLDVKDIFVTKSHDSDATPIASGSGRSLMGSSYNDYIGSFDMHTTSKDDLSAPLSPINSVGSHEGDSAVLFSSSTTSSKSEVNDGRNHFSIASATSMHTNNPIDDRLEILNLPHEAISPNFSKEISQTEKTRIPNQFNTEASLEIKSPGEADKRETLEEQSINANESSSKPSYAPNKSDSIMETNETQHTDANENSERMQHAIQNHESNNPPIESISDCVFISDSQDSDATPIASGSQRSLNSELFDESLGSLDLSVADMKDPPSPFSPGNSNNSQALMPSSNFTVGQEASNSLTLKGQLIVATIPRKLQDTTQEPRDLDSATAKKVDPQIGRPPPLDMSGDLKVEPNTSLIRICSGLSHRQIEPFENVEMIIQDEIGMDYQPENEALSRESFSGKELENLLSKEAQDKSQQSQISHEHKLNEKITQMDTIEIFSPQNTEMLKKNPAPSELAIENTKGLSIAAARINQVLVAHEAKFPLPTKSPLLILGESNSTISEESDIAPVVANIVAEMRAELIREGVTGFGLGGESCSTVSDESDIAAIVSGGVEESNPEHNQQRTTLEDAKVKPVKHSSETSPAVSE